MPSKALKRKATPVTADTIERSTPPDYDLADCSPEWLRDRVFNALNRLSTHEHQRVRDRILSDLRKAGVNIMSGLVMLGIPASMPDELSSSDIAKLVRYVRINMPGAMKVVSGTLAELIAPEAEKPGGVKPVRKAA
jgi:hypothetical protein